MTTSTQPSLAGLSKAFSETVSRTLASIGAAQAATAAQKKQKDQAEKAALDARVDKARVGLHRLLEFGASPEMQQVARDMGRLPNQGPAAPFYDLKWAEIGGQMTSALAIAFEEAWVRIVAVDYCHVIETKTFLVTYGTGATRYEEVLAGRDPCEEQLLEEDFLRRIAHKEVLDLSELDEIEGVYAPAEEEVLFQQLVDWAEPKAFRTAVVGCMRELKETVQQIDHAI
jgi:hypothetical protein